MDENVSKSISNRAALVEEGRGKNGVQFCMRPLKECAVRIR